MQTNFKRSTVAANTNVIDEGLRSFLIGVYQYMAGGLALTGLASYLFSTSNTLMALIYGTPLKWIVMLAPLGMVVFLSARIHALSYKAAQLSFWAYSTLMGLSLTWIFMVYTGESITKVFFITSSLFGAMSLYGYTTKKDLSAFGSFLFMGLIGIVIAMVVNMFLASPAFDFAISVIAVLVFTGLTAYHTQNIKQIYYAGDASETAGKKAIMGALDLYLAFINLFIHLLRLMGDRR